MLNEKSGMEIEERAFRQMNMRKSICQMILLVLIMLMILSCSGASDQNTPEIASDGRVLISLADAQGDFLSYTVDVVSLTLTKATGEVVQALSQETRVDFAQYGEMSEFLTAASLTPGVYTRATIVLRFKSRNVLAADIRVEGPNGGTVMIEDIEDENGKAISCVEMSVDLENQNALWVRPEAATHLELDFNLRASNAVTFTDPASPVLTVLPVLLAEVNPPNQRIHRLRGAFKSLDAEADAFDIILRPFYHSISDKSVHLGTQTIDIEDETVFDVDGSHFVGKEGLAAMAALPNLTAVEVFGVFDPKSDRLIATEISMGAGVPGSSMDAVQGSVARRTGNTLSIEGGALIRRNGNVKFKDTLLVQIGPGTRVRQQFSTDTFDTGDISVGQRVTISGNLSPDEKQMDAEQGAVCMQLTTLNGVVLTNDVPLVVTLHTIDQQRVDGFDFKGTGRAMAADADPGAYSIDTDAMDISSLPSGTPLKVRGFVAPFGHAEGQNDFKAVTIVDVPRTKAVLHTGWRPASKQAIADLTPDGFIVHLQDGDLGLFHHLMRSGVATDLTQLDVGTAVIPETNEKNERIGIFSIVQNQIQQTFFSFDNFADELSARLDEGGAIRWVKASGNFDDDTGTLTANWIRIKLKSVPLPTAEISPGSPRS